MKKKYKDEVIQYNLKGDIIQTFKDASEASKYVSNYDSIINCCLGKYKTTSGYIFRFKSSTPSILKSSTKKHFTHKCKICNSEETTRSMAMHLRWAHGIKTEDYIEKYGEFRPKKIKENKLKQKSNIICKICDKKLKSNQHLMHHITKSHPETSHAEYLIKYVYENKPPLCKCGCGQPVTLLKAGKNSDLQKETYNRDYIKGHWDWEVFSNVNHQSKEELQVLNYIKSIYSGEIIENYRFEKKYEIDIFLPELNLGIEYNGLYWHCEERGRGKKYHINKTLKAKENNIRLIQIFSDEWINKQDIVKSKLKSILGLNTNKIYARKCIVKPLNKKDKNKFLDKYHIQGKDRCKVSLGVFFKGDLIGVMTFSTPRIALGGDTSQKDTWELSRYATSTPIVGGASKLIKYFQKQYSPKKIYSYSDNRWTDWKNNMYTSIGFIFKKISSPGYWYTKDYLNRIHRYNFNKNRLVKLGMGKHTQTEAEIMISNGYNKIWDCGSALYIKNFN
jgi:hypothetical protein